jgi:hypothetical protein
VVPPPAAGQFLHDLQAAAGDGLDALDRYPGGGRRQPVPPAAVTIEDLADEFAPAAEAAQVEPELGTADARG